MAQPCRWAAGRGALAPPIQTCHGCPWRLARPRRPWLPHRLRRGARSDQPRVHPHPRSSRRPGRPTPCAATPVATHHRRTSVTHAQSTSAPRALVALGLARPGRSRVVTEARTAGALHRKRLRLLQLRSCRSSLVQIRQCRPEAVRVQGIGWSGPRGIVLHGDDVEIVCLEDHDTPGRNVAPVVPSARAQPVYNS